MKKMIRFMSLLLCVGLLMCFQMPVFANSAQTWWEGVDGSGAVVTEDNSPIVVEHENLSFDLQAFPEIYSANAYGGTVTAEYTFYNPADYTVTARLLFPFGERPDYAEGYFHDVTGEYIYLDDTDDYNITIDGAAVEKTLRHSFLTDIHYFDLEEDLQKLSDRYVEDAFFTPGMTVTEYVYSVEDLGKAVAAGGVTAEAYPTPEPNAHVTTNVTLDDTNIKLLVMGVNGMSLQDDGSCSFTSWVAAGEYISVVVFGGTLEPLNWSFYESGTQETELPGVMELTEIKTGTFEEFAMADYDPDSGILAHDWYNAKVAAINHGGFSGGVVATDEFVYLDELRENLLHWYEYQITLEPGQKMVNSVTAPMYPTVDGDTNPYTYEYTYLLSPASTWADFGTLEVTVNTPYYMLESGLEGFEKTEAGYTLKWEGLPERELTFTLCSEPEVKVQQSHSVNDIFMWIPLIGIILVAAAIVVVCKKLHERYSTK